MKQYNEMLQLAKNADMQELHEFTKGATLSTEDFVRFVGVGIKFTDGVDLSHDGVDFSDPAVEMAYLNMYESLEMYRLLTGLSLTPINKLLLDMDFLGLFKDGLCNSISTEELQDTCMEIKDCSIKIEST